MHEDQDDPSTIIDYVTGKENPIQDVDGIYDPQYCKNIHISSTL